MDNFSEKNHFFLNMPGFFYIKNKELQYVYANKNYLRLLGLKTISDIAGKHDEEFRVGFTDDFIYDDYRVVNEELSISKPHVFTCANKFKTCINWEKKPNLDEADQIIGVIAFGTDISGIQKKLDETYNQKTLLEDIIYNLPGLIYWKNTNSEYVAFNRNVVELSGLSKEALYGKTDIELNWGKEQAEQFVQEDKDIIQNGKIHVTESELPIKHSDNHNMVVRTEKSKLYDRNGNIMGVLGVAMDITDQKILESDLRDAIQKSEKMAAEKSEFLRNMEHDIRTPFSGLYSLTELMENDEQDSGKREMLQAMKACSRELLHYLNNIIDFSQIESGFMVIQAKKFSLKKIAQDVIAMEKPVALSKNLSIELEYAPNTPQFFVGDELRIEKLLLNLVGNAVKFTEKGFVKLKIERIREINHSAVVLRIYVQDTGIGIPSNKKDYIFETFSKLHASNTNKYKGAGLGLAVVKFLIKELQGEIEVQSETGQGTTFICTLPLQIALVDDEPF